MFLERWSHYMWSTPVPTFPGDLGSWKRFTEDREEDSKHLGHWPTEADTKNSHSEPLPLLPTSKSRPQTHCLSLSGWICFKLKIKTINNDNARGKNKGKIFMPWDITQTYLASPLSRSFLKSRILQQDSSTPCSTTPCWNCANALIRWLSSPTRQRGEIALEIDRQFLPATEGECYKKIMIQSLCTPQNRLW